MVTAAPSGKDQDTHLVSLLEKIVRLELAFKANCIQAEMTHVAQFVVEALSAGADEHVIAQPSAADKNIAPVDLEQPVPVWIHFRRNLADTKLRRLPVRNVSIVSELHGDCVQVLRTQLVRPPKLGILDAQLRKLIGSEDHGLMLIRSQRHRLAESASGVYYGVDRAAYLVVSRVLKLRDCSKFGGVERSISEMRIHRWIA